MKVSQLTFWAEVVKDTKITKEVIRVKLSNLNNPKCHHPTNRRQANLDLLEIFAKGYSAVSAISLGM